MNNAKITVLSLPQEIIHEEILPRLPAKSLLRFKCVSKSWHSLIGSKHFIEKHLQNSKNSQTYDNWSVIFNCAEHGLTQAQCSLSSYMEEPTANGRPINDPAYDHLMTDGRVVGCCNGLLCIANAKESRVFLWNPSTRISFMLPEIDLDFGMMKYGFGWDEQRNAYKVFVGLSCVGDHDPLGKVYSSKTNSWETVEYGSLDCVRPTGTFVCGRIHWLTTAGYIETFNLASEVFGTIELPCNNPSGFWMWLFEIGGYLCLICDSFWNRERRVWTMKEYGLKESWVEEIRYPQQSKNRCCATVFYPQTLVSPLPQKNC